MFRQTEVNGFEADKYVTEQVFYPSKDGTKVPMFIVHRKVSVACLRSDWSECRVECGITPFIIHVKLSQIVQVIVVNISAVHKCEGVK